jgi:hypothetical protein
MPPSTSIEQEHLKMSHRATASSSTYRWEGTRIEGLCNKKLWSILRQLGPDNGKTEPTTHAAVKAELSARGEHASAAQWQSPH